MAHFTVIGLGRFGIAASMELLHLGHTVTGVDRNVQLAEKNIDDFTQLLICDSTDESALKELDLANSDAVLVAIGEDMESSLLCILALKKLGVTEIWVKANSRAHHTIVSKLGVSRIIHPEEEMGVRVAQALNYPMVNDYLSIGHGLYVVEILISQSLETPRLGDLLVPTQGTIEAVMVKRETTLFNHLDADFMLKAKDILLLCGSRDELKKLVPRLV